MRTRLKSAKTWLSRQTFLYRAWFRARGLAYGGCELLSQAVSRLAGREVRLGVDLLSVREDPAAPRYELAACLRFKNEATYLAEWIDFHRLVGFEHFYLYDNNSTDGFREVLEPYVQEGIVTLHAWPAVPASPGADLHCIRHYRHETRWLAFIDADEFLFANTEVGLAGVLREFEAAPAVAVNWIYFGSAGHRQRPEGLVTENYCRRCQYPNRHVKTIVNPRRAIRYGNSHHWFYAGGKPAVNEAGLPVYGSFHEPATAERLRINHYYCKSAEEFLAKSNMKSWVDREGAQFPSRTEDALRRVFAANNDVEDTRACRIAEGIRAPSGAAL